MRGQRSVRLCSVAGGPARLIYSTRAMPASYPFTTLQPNLCVLDFDDREMTRVTIADIPGLIEGASENRGLGRRCPPRSRLAHLTRSACRP